MRFHLAWVRPEAPYMPIMVVGLLSALEDAGDGDARAGWKIDGPTQTLAVETALGREEIGAAIAEAPWPDLSRIPWSQRLGQAIKPMLAAAPDPIAELHRLRADVRASGLVAEGRLLEAFVTDGVVDGGGGPGRSRLLRGVKADLSGISDQVDSDPGGLIDELEAGPKWRSGKSGRGLGLVPEVQTFGGSTGPTPSDVGSHSALLYRLLWLGILRLPPVPVSRGPRRVVGGPLVCAPESLGWPLWTVELPLAPLRALLSLSSIHEAEPDSARLVDRGVAAVFRAESVPINSMVAVFRWGKRVA